MTTAIFLMYLADISFVLRVFIGAVAFFFISVCFVMWDDDYGLANILRKHRKITILSLFFAIAICVLIPSQTFLYALAGLKAGDEIVKHEKVNSLLEKSYKVLDKKLDEILESNTKGQR